MFTHKVYANTKLGRVRLPLDKSFTDKHGSITEDEAIDLIFRDYSEKQWGVPWEHLPSTIKNRVPKVLSIYKDGYFDDKWQGVPLSGYTNMIETMLIGCDVRLGQDPHRWKNHKADLVVYTGRPDTLFRYSQGELGFRSLDLRHGITDRRDVCVINECNKKPYTRSYDHSYWSKRVPDKTVITYEYPKACTIDDIPYYPYPDVSNLILYDKYAKMASKHDIILLGRLGRYKYLNMDEAILEALTLAERIVA
jgi:UDP-galactopyranose mutase